VGGGSKMNWIVLILGIIFIPLLIMYCIQRGKQKKAGLLWVIAIMICCTPFFGYFIVEAMPNHKTQCKHCGNKYNESIYCGICGKDEAGNTLIKNQE
jgi:D-alanyl-lipoteichoic acid acyltransferase DltB (MBOAT superfamily)